MYEIINPFIPEFLQWTLPSLNLDTSINANRDIRKKIWNQMVNSVDPDETAHTSRLIWIHTVCICTKTCVRQPPLKLTLVIDVERWLSYKGTCTFIRQTTFPHQPLFKVSLEGGSLTQVLLCIWFGLLG